VPQEPGKSAHAPLDVFGAEATPAAVLQPAELCLGELILRREERALGIEHGRVRGAGSALFIHSFHTK
jgi:hypothetical protein